MKKMILSAVVLITLSISTAFAYELSSKDKKILESLEPVLENMYTEDRQRFEEIQGRVDNALLKLEADTRMYELILGIRDIMTDIDFDDSKESIVIDNLFVTLDRMGELKHELLLVEVIDGDTVILKDKKTGEDTTYRLIGIDAPETSALRYGVVEEFGKESRDYLLEAIEGSDFYIEYDESQGTTDDYGRDLVYLRTVSMNFNQDMIEKGYAKEYTYDKPYKYQSEFQAAEEKAQEGGLGIWGLEEKTINSSSFSGFSDAQSDGVCNIKGNISSSDEKIYHYEGCQSYNKTKISPEKGEQYFCSAKEAEDAGWRVAGNCN